MSAKMIKCKSCGNDISSDAKACPSCGAKVKKPIYKKWWFWLIVVILVVSIAGASGSGDDSSPDTGSESVITTQASDKDSETEVQKVTTTELVETMGQKNARKKAESYLRFSAFSREGLIDQLEYEGFTNEDSVYAVDKLNVDWNEQAAKKAESYLDFSSFSRDGLIDQLEYEGFTYEQAVYGVEAVGY